MKSLIVACITALSFAPASTLASGFYVGNGGDGYLTPDGVAYISDLYIRGKDTYESPDVKPVAKVDQSLALKPARDIEFPAAILTEKIQRLNLAAPGVGVIVKDAILSFRWTFVDETLGRTRDTQCVFVDTNPSGGVKYVQIANRLGNEIRISRELWYKMPEAHKAALVLHEVLYGIMSRKDLPAVPPFSKCPGSIHPTRYLNAQLFSPVPMPAKSELLNLLKLNDLVSECSDKYVKKTGDDSRAVTFEAGSRSLRFAEEAFALERVSATSREICETVGFNPAEEIEFSFYRLPFALSWTQDFSLRLTPRTSEFSSSLKFGDVETCSAYFGSALQAWITSGNESPDLPLNSCSFTSL